MAVPLRKDVPEPYGGEFIFRTTSGADGRVSVLQLPPTLENVLDPRLEDEGAQNNPHARTLSPMAVAVRCLALQDIATGKRIWFHVDERRLRLEAEQRAEEAERHIGEEARRNAETLVLVLESRGLDLTEAERRRILACRDGDTLRRWTLAAVAVRAPSELRT